MAFKAFSLSLALCLLATLVTMAFGDFFSLTATVTPRPVNVGQSANLTCHLEFAAKQRLTYSVYWYSPNGAEVAENCIAYRTDKHSTFCDNPDPKLATRYTLLIKTVAWEDRGSWTCKFVTNQSYVFLDVNLPPAIESFAATPIGQPNYDAAAAAGQSSLAAKADGSAAAPYDLTIGGGLNFTCRTTCGYPAAQLRLDYQSVSVQLPAPSSPDAFRVRHALKNDSCLDAQNNLLRTAEATALLVNCSALKLDGKTKFQCAIGDAEMPQFYKDIYVYCPAIARDYPLTQGEIAAASVGAVLGVFLIILGFVLFCQRKPAEELDESASQPMQV